MTKKLISIEKSKISHSLFEDFHRVAVYKHKAYGNYQRVNVYVEGDKFFIKQSFEIYYNGPLQQVIDQMLAQAAGLEDPVVERVYAWENSLNEEQLAIQGYVQVTDTDFIKLIQKAIKETEEHEHNLKALQEERIREQARKLGMKD